LSAAELVADALSAAAALDPALHFMDSLAPDSALEAAARIDALPCGQRGGLALAGVPFLAKAGTTVASPVAGRLVRAGAVRLADPAAGWLPPAALDRGQITDLPRRTGTTSP
jgi:Asp-tRNA(Asn)/Glu-tRNA(Gln) amidotransferase A subunit family amidase